MWPWKKAAPNFNLHTQDYVVLDTETTGFHQKNDRIISIGLVRMRGAVILMKEAVEWYVKSDFDLGKSPEIHGITQENLVHAVGEAESVTQFQNFVSDAVLVAHYARFDRNMLAEMAKRAGLPPAQNRWLDTMDVQVAVEPTMSEQAELLKLDSLLQRYDIEALARHTALGDAYSTALLFQRQLALLSHQGIQSFHALPKPRKGLL